MTTKEKILYEALTLFSQKGYDAVGMEEIARRVGIKAPSIYKHYKGKRDILNSIVALMREKYYGQTDKMRLHLSDFTQDVELFSKIGEDELSEKKTQLVKFYLHDDYLGKFRRLTAIEQYQSEEFARMHQHYEMKVLKYHTELFAGLMEMGVIKKDDPTLAALEFVTPIRFFVAQCDRESAREAEFIGMIDKHIRLFYRMWSVT